MLLAGALGCWWLWEISDEARAEVRPPSAPASDSRPALSPGMSVGYPVDASPPKDFFCDSLLRTLTREASAIVVCKLRGLNDVLPARQEPDTFYDAECDVTEVRAGSVGADPFHFVWQVEGGSGMPPPGSDLLVYLKRRKQPLDAPPSLKWVALDTGVMRYTEALRHKLDQASHRRKKGN